MIWDFQPLLTAGAKQAIDVDQLYTMVDNFASTLFEDRPTEQLLVREGLTKVIAFFAEYARYETSDEVVEELPVSELIRLTRLNNRSSEDPHV